jgi:hypothetical protein
MSYDVHVISISEFLRTDVTGIVDLDASRALLRELVATAARCNVDRVLLDGRNARARVSTADIWTLASELGALGVQDHRIAFLLSPPEGDFDRGAFSRCAPPIAGTSSALFTISSRPSPG